MPAALLSILLCSLALTAPAWSATTELPSGYEMANWGITVAELKKQTTVFKASPGSEYNYSEHMEVNPDVYVQKVADKRIEYYFFRGKLYKIFILYNRALANPESYQKLISQQSKKYGPPQRRYQEVVFGLQVQHASWSDKESSLDLRLGAGYVYQVRTQKSVAAAKKLLQQMRHSI
jgi:hypothetical protein